MFLQFLLPLSAIIRQPLYLTVNSLNLEVMCVWSRVVQRKVVVGSSDWCFNNLSGSHHQSQKKKKKKILLRLVNVSHYWPQQFFSGLHSLRWSNFITSKATITFPYKRNEFIKKIALLPLDRHLAGFLKFVVFFQPGESKITDLHQVLPHNQDIPCSKVSVK